MKPWFSFYFLCFVSQQRAPINVLIVGVGMPKAMLLVISPDPRKRHTLFVHFNPICSFMMVHANTVKRKAHDRR